MNAAAVVSAECPTCGAPLDFEDVARAIRCGHCRSQLLVTGRRQVLTYEIEPRISESDARSLVRFGLPADRQSTHVAPGRLHLVPYYRFTAEEIRWENSDAERQRRRNVAEVAGMLGVAVPGKGGREDPIDPDGDVGFSSRVIERNFVARKTAAVPHSLGVRPAALQLRLFDHPGDEDRAVVVAADLTPREAQERAASAAGSDSPSRELLRAVLQIVYFPFWMVPTGGGGRASVTVVDAVAGGIVKEGVEPTEVEALSKGRRRKARTVGFRPLACPNCGWDLPLRPDDLLFQCSSCERGWLARGDRLEPVVFSVVRGSGEITCHLPVWKLGGDEGVAVFAPAFRCRRLKALYDLGARLTRQATTIARAEDVPAALVGCSLDELDARALARFIAAGIAEESSRGAVRPEIPENLDALSAELLWLPFTSDGYALREPTTGAPVPTRLLDLAL